MRYSKRNRHVRVTTQASLLASLCILFCLGLHPLSAQDPMPPHDERLCGFHQANAPETMRRAEENTRRAFPGLDTILQRSLSKTTSPTLGTQEVFWTYNFTANRYDTIRAELLATGTLSYVWVAVGELANNHVTRNEVDAILNALENRTPASSQDSTRGILQLARRFFGDPPNINSNFVKGAGDGRTHFLIYDIVDGFTGTGSYVAGYFHSKDVQPGTYSNRRDMLYIDSYPTIFFNNQRNPEAPLGLLAHEFQHLIHWNYDPSEIPFFNEGLSELATYLVGYELRSPGRYLSNPNVALLGWSSNNDRVLADYSRAALMTYYLWDRFGETFIRALTQQPLSGVDGFNAAMVAAGFNTNLVAVVKNFQVANYLQNLSVGPMYGYAAPLAGMGRPRIQRDNFGPISSGTRTGVEPLGVEYIRLRVMDSLHATLSITSGIGELQVVRTSTGGTTVSSLSPGAPYETGFLPDEKKPEVVFLIHNTRTTGTLVSYSYLTTGTLRTGATLELAHDDGRTQRPPTTILATNDTIHVAFEGVTKSKIDSVAMWFQTPGSASLMIRDWNSAYDLTAQPLSGLSGRARLVSPISFTVTDTGYMRTVVDLRGRNVGSNTDFLVQIIYGFSAPHPLLRRDSSQGAVHSFLSVRSQPTPGRIIYQSLGDFYVRVYLSYNEQEIDQPPPTVTTLVLGRNYPNPFSPTAGQTTVIEYGIPQDAHVELEVVDLLGRRVKLLEDRSRFAGFSTVEWDGKDNDGIIVPSGVYFVRLQASGMTRAIKVLVLR